MPSQIALRGLEFFRSSSAYKAFFDTPCPFVPGTKIDFEWLGNNKTAIQTNYYVNHQVRAFCFKYGFIKAVQRAEVQRSAFKDRSWLRNFPLIETPFGPLGLIREN
jgi:hypothetical protein